MEKTIKESHTVIAEDIFRRSMHKSYTYIPTSIEVGMGEARDMFNCLFLLLLA